MHSAEGLFALQELIDYPDQGPREAVAEHKEKKSAEIGFGFGLSKLGG